MTTQHPQDDPVLAELLDILTEHGAMTAAAIVDRARDRANPLHDEFEWSDKTAAHEYRLSQARALVRRYRIDIIEPDVTLRRFVSVESPDGRGYVETVRALDDPFFRQQILDRMLTEARSLADRYRRYSEAAGLVDLIDQWIVEHEGALTG